MLVVMIFLGVKSKISSSLGQKLPLKLNQMWYKPKKWLKMSVMDEIEKSGSMGVI